MKKKVERCGAYAEHRITLGKPRGWKGCSKPRGHKGFHNDIDKLDGEHYCGDGWETK